MILLPNLIRVTYLANIKMSCLVVELLLRIVICLRFPAITFHWLIEGQLAAPKGFYWTADGQTRRLGYKQQVHSLMCWEVWRIISCRVSGLFRKADLSRICLQLSDGCEVFDWLDSSILPGNHEQKIKYLGFLTPCDRNIPLCAFRIILGYCLRVFFFHFCYWLH